MPPKIERIWGGFFGNSQIVRKNATDDNKEKNKNSSDHHSSSGDGSGNSSSENAVQITYSKDEIIKAINEVKQSGAFPETEVSLSCIETKNGLMVKLSHFNGTLIRMMSPAEFMSLKENAIVDSRSRGKILDQRY